MKDYREEKLLRGQIGTIVESYGDGEFEIEFADNQGRTIALLTLSVDEIMLLHNEPAKIES